MGRTTYLTRRLTCGRMTYMNHTNNSYHHPSEGQPLAVRFLIAVAAIGFLLLICSAPKANAAYPNPHKFGGKCRVVASDADHDTGRIARIAARHGGVDYRGRLAFSDRVGRWTTNDTGKVFGYSLEEDSIVYDSARCARTRPLYIP